MKRAFVIAWLCWLPLPLAWSDPTEMPTDTPTETPTETPTAYPTPLVMQFTNPTPIIAVRTKVAQGTPLPQAVEDSRQVEGCAFFPFWGAVLLWDATIVSETAPQLLFAKSVDDATWEYNTCHLSPSYEINGSLLETGLMSGGSVGQKIELKAWPLPAGWPCGATTTPPANQPAGSDDGIGMTYLGTCTQTPTHTPTYTNTPTRTSTPTRTTVPARFSGVAPVIHRASVQFGETRATLSAPGYISGASWACVPQNAMRVWVQLQLSGVISDGTATYRLWEWGPDPYGVRDDLTPTLNDTDTTFSLSFPSGSSLVSGVFSVPVIPETCNFIAAESIQNASSASRSTIVIHPYKRE